MMKNVCLSVLNFSAIKFYDYSRFYTHTHTHTSSSSSSAHRIFRFLVFFLIDWFREPLLQNFILFIHNIRIRDTSAAPFHNLKWNKRWSIQILVVVVVIYDSSIFCAMYVCVCVYSTLFRQCHFSIAITNIHIVKANEYMNSSST